MENNIIGVILPNTMELDETAVHMPIINKGKALGFVSAVNDKMVVACLWTENWEVMRDEDGNFLHIDIDANNDITYPFVQE